MFLLWLARMRLPSARFTAADEQMPVFFLWITGLCGFSLFIRLLYGAAVRKGWIYPFNHKPGSGTMTAAALSVQAILEPSKKYVLEEKVSRRRKPSRIGELMEDDLPD
jgi:hypothetical protein